MHKEESIVSLDIFHLARTGDVAGLWYLLDASDASLDNQNLQGMTPLMLACQHGQVEAVRLLLRLRADPNIGDLGGNTPLIQACGDDNDALIAALLEGGADVNLSNRQGVTALMVLAVTTNKAPLWRLLAHDADPQLKDSRGRRAIEVALEYGRTGSMQILSLYPTKGLYAACCSDIRG